MGIPNNLLYLQVFESYTLRQWSQPFCSCGPVNAWQFSEARCQAKFLTSRHVHMHKVIFYISAFQTFSAMAH